MKFLRVLQRAILVMDISADRYCISRPYVPTILIHHTFFTIKTFLVTYFYLTFYH